MRETGAEVSEDMSIEQRRRKLLAEGALLRLGILEARGQVRENLNAEALAKGALKRLLGSAGSTIGGLFSGKRALNWHTLQSVSPLLLSALSLVAKRGLRKPLMYGGIISMAAAAAYLLTRPPRADDEQAESAATSSELIDPTDSAEAAIGIE